MSNNQGNNHLALVHTNLNSLIEGKRDALPKDFNQTRFIQNCMTVLQDTKGIEKVKPKSIARTLLKGAFLGLDFMNKECYAIPYGSDLQFQTDYRGEKKLAKKYSVNPIKDIYAKLVREGEDFVYEVEDGKQILNHRINPFNNGKVMGVYAIALFEDDSKIIETMSIDEVEEIRNNFSKMKNGQAWQKSFNEMAKKTVIRRLCKHIELDFDNVEQKEAFDDGSDATFNNDTPKVEYVSGEQVEFLLNNNNPQKVMEICERKNYNISKLTTSEYMDIQNELNNVIDVDVEVIESEEGNNGT